MMGTTFERLSTAIDGGVDIEQEQMVTSKCSSLKWVCRPERRTKEDRKVF
jgi:hypothetical protein